MSAGVTPPDPVVLQAYDGEWPDDDPDANFKTDVAALTLQDPLPTFQRLSANTGIPLGALVRYALVRWTSEGSEALLALGPVTVRRMAALVRAAEEDGGDHARLEAYERLRQMIGWLEIPLDEDVRA